jgi:hypothetical protein
VEKRQAVSAWALVAMLVIAVLAACGEKNEAPKPTPGVYGQGVNVDKAWDIAREVTGHRIHVIKNKIECTKCHTPTATGMGPVTPDRCTSCHEKESHIEHARAEAEQRFGPGTKAICTACHAFTLEGTKHDEAMLKGEPPRVAMDGGAGRYAFGIEAYEANECKRCHATAQGNTPAVVVHGSQPCLTCHHPHDGPPASAPCTDCHKEISTTHASAGKSIVEVCSTCHEHRHSPAKDALGTCTECHSKQEPIIPATALFEKGHTECTGCHKPHDFDEKQAVPCRNCHENLNVIGGGRIAAHNGCTNCHSPHNVMGSPFGACANCHKNVHSDHPAQGACVSCHDPHPAQVAATVDVKACTSCHKFADSDHGAHRDTACPECHKPHQFEIELANVALCSNCHSERVHEVASNKGHQACTNCHRGLPHHPEVDKVACSSCHHEEAGHVNAGHKQCTGCHEPHSGAQGTPCGTCHQAEKQSAPAGHQACTNCHEPHAGLPVQKTCPQCHQAEQQSAHGQLASGCQTCHRPHGPKGVAAMPACTSCHQAQTLPGLHAEAKHQPCTQCHQGHADPAAMARQVCTTCHRDRDNHYPESPRCVGCHLFTKTP